MLHLWKSYLNFSVRAARLSQSMWKQILPHQKESASLAQLMMANLLAASSMGLISPTDAKAVVGYNPLAAIGTWEGKLADALTPHRKAAVNYEKYKEFSAVGRIISAEIENNRSNAGTGTIIEQDGRHYILTCMHVFQGLRGVSVDPTCPSRLIHQSGSLGVFEIGGRTYDISGIRMDPKEISSVLRAGAVTHGAITQHNDICLLETTRAINTRKITVPKISTIDPQKAKGMNIPYVSKGFGNIAVHNQTQDDLEATDTPHAYSGLATYDTYGRNIVAKFGAKMFGSIAQQLMDASIFGTSAPGDSGSSLMYKEGDSLTVAGILHGGTFGQKLDTDESSFVPVYGRFSWLESENKKQRENTKSEIVKKEPSKVVPPQVETKAPPKSSSNMRPMFDRSLEKELKGYDLVDFSERKVSRNTTCFTYTYQNKRGDRYIIEEDETISSASQNARNKKK